MDEATYSVSLASLAFANKSAVPEENRNGWWSIARLIFLIVDVMGELITRYYYVLGNLYQYY